MYVFFKTSRVELITQCINALYHAIAPSTCSVTWESQMHPSPNLITNFTMHCNAVHLGSQLNDQGQMWVWRLKIWRTTTVGHSGWNTLNFPITVYWVPFRNLESIQRQWRHESRYSWGLTNNNGTKTSLKNWTHHKICNETHNGALGSISINRCNLHGHALPQHWAKNGPLNLQYGHPKWDFGTVDCQCALKQQIVVQ